jgi:restriction endonuclease S subunit
MVNIKLKLLLTFIVLLPPGFIQTGFAQQAFEKAAYYNTMSTGDVDAIDKELAIVQSSGLNNKEGYEGALLMKKAGMIKGARKKLDLFKAGRIKLETAINTDNEHTEFHFLRLAIEENAPRIVKYRADIPNDKLIIIKNFKTLSPAVQRAVLDYCNNSKVLHTEDFSSR